MLKLGVWMEKLQNNFSFCVKIDGNCGGVMNKYNEYGINVNNEKMLYYKLQDVFYYDEMKVIKNFTSNSFIEKLKDKKYNFSIKKNNASNYYCLESSNLNISFKRISDVIYMEDKAKLNKLKSILLSLKKRKRKCHQLSIRYVNSGYNIVTGYINDESGIGRIIHTWLENDFEVLDFTFNLKIDKDVYYYLLKAESLNVISYEKRIQDDELINELSLKMYCLFRDEIKKDFKRNKLVLKK